VLRFSVHDLRVRESTKRLTDITQRNHRNRAVCLVSQANNPTIGVIPVWSGAVTPRFNEKAFSQFVNTSVWLPSAFNVI